MITHAHSDHARIGHGHYLAAQPAKPCCARGWATSTLQTLAYGERIVHHGVTLSLHPAGHVLGSAQVRLEHGGQVWVASGDYKVAPDATCAPFEPVRCDVFITESTFGLPIYRWCPDAELFADINDWWARNVVAGRASVLICYSFGKAQRILSGVDPSIGPIIVHGAVEPLNRAYRAGRRRRCRRRATVDRGEGQGRPAARAGGLPAQRRRPARGCGASATRSTAFASGWMQVRGTRRRGGCDRGFVLSDHADWPGLLRRDRAPPARSA